MAVDDCMESSDFSDADESVDCDDGVDGDAAGVDGDDGAADGLTGDVSDVSCGSSMSLRAPASSARGVVVALR